MEKLISIIVPVFRVEKYLPKCIDSILNQTYRNLEIIIVDDGSKDRSSIICDEYSKKDNRIKVIHKTNGGLSSARNIGIINATGDYIAFVDSDDWLEKDMYKTLMNSMESSDSDIVICAYNKVTDTGNFLYKQKLLKSENEEVFISKKRSQMEYFENKENRDIYTVVWNKLFRKQLIEKYSFTEGVLHEDESFVFKILYDAKKITYINTCFYNYVVRENSIMSKEFDKSRFSLFDAYLERVDFYLEKNEKNLCDKMIKQYMRMFCQYIEWSKTAPDRNKIVVKEYHNKLINKKKDLKKVISFKTRFEMFLYGNLELYFYIWKLKNSK